MEVRAESNFFDLISTVTGFGYRRKRRSGAERRARKAERPLCLFVKQKVSRATCGCEETVLSGFTAVCCVHPAYRRAPRPSRVTTAGGDSSAASAGVWKRPRSGALPAHSPAGSSPPVISAPPQIGCVPPAASAKVLTPRGGGMSPGWC